MTKYYKEPDYYPDDKDVYDFLCGVNASEAGLRTFLRSMGIISSPAELMANLSEYVSGLYFDWQSLNKLVDLVEIRDTTERKRSKLVKWSADAEQMRQAVNAVQSKRHDQEREKYRVECIATGFKVSVDYIEVDTSKTRVIQKREKDLEIQICQTDQGFSLRYNGNERAEAIVANLLVEITKLNQDLKPNVEEVTLSNIIDPCKRVEFFKKMMKGIHGLDLQDVTNLSVDKLLVSAPEEALTEEDDSRENDDEIEEQLEKVRMYGKHLFTAEEFQHLVSKGFFISSANWLSELEGTTREQIEFMACFRHPQEGTHFEYKVLGKRTMGSDGELTKTSQRLEIHEQQKYLEALDAAARDALKEIV